MSALQMYFFSPFLVGEDNLTYFYLIISCLEGEFDTFLPRVGDLWTSVSEYTIIKSDMFPYC